MNIDTKYNIGDIVYGISVDGSTSHGKIEFFFIGKKGIEVALDDGHYSCYLDSIGDTESEAFERYCKLRYAELMDEVAKLTQLAEAHNINLNKGTLSCR